MSSKNQNENRMRTVVGWLLCLAGIGTAWYLYAARRANVWVVAIVAVVTLLLIEIVRRIPMGRSVQ